MRLSFLSSARNLLSLALVALSACGGRPAPIVHRTAETAGDIHAVTARGIASVHVLVGASGPPAIDCDARLAPHIRIRNEQGTLVVDETEHRSFENIETCVVTVRVPVLRAIEASGTGDVHVDSPADGLARVDATGSGDVTIAATVAPRLDLRATGSGDVRVQGIEVGELVATASGSGNVEASGKARSALVRANGSGDVKARSLATEEGRVEATGSGDVHLSASRRAAVRATGSGDVFIAGRPEDRKLEQTGSGRIRME